MLRFIRRTLKIDGNPVGLSGSVSPSETTFNVEVWCNGTTEPIRVYHSSGLGRIEVEELGSGEIRLTGHVAVPGHGSGS